MSNQYENLIYVFCLIVGAIWITKLAKIGLRDYFAARAMQGLISSPRLPAPSAYGGTDVTDNMVSDLAYKVADAMMKARSK